MSTHDDLMAMAANYRKRAASIPEEATRLGYNAAPSIRDMLQKAELYEATARDVQSLPEDQAEAIARRFRSAMWLRDERPDFEPDDYHP
jgi:DNA-binding ferritin-like protein